VAFVRKSRLRCKAVAASFAEAGEELFSLTAFPVSCGTNVVRYSA
jgi:hypothetical protein